MIVKVKREDGIIEAMHGIGLSYNISTSFDELNDDVFNKLICIANRLSRSNNGENKFLRQISVWLDITAPLYWWKEFDTYKVGTTAQSTSTMHTLLTAGVITNENFEHPIDDTILSRLENLRKNKEFSTLINELPCGWLQRRIVSCNYAVLQNIINQRRNHKLPEWHEFCASVINGVSHPGWIDITLKEKE